MVIQYGSDLHLEFTDNARYVAQHPIEPVGEVLILAGDITTLSLIDAHRAGPPFFKLLAKQFKRVFWICGNHEFYQSWDASVLDKPLCQAILPNVFLLNNTALEYGGVRFVFTTLWSYIDDLDGIQIQPNMSDFQLIRYRGRMLTTGMYTNRLHNPSVAFLNAQFAQPSPLPTVVISHHLPSLQCVHDRHRGSSLNPAFATDLDTNIMRWQPDYWIYGHSHANMPPVAIGKTQLITNQLGYVAYSEMGLYRPDATITV